MIPSYYILSLLLIYKANLLENFLLKSYINRYNIVELVAIKRKSKEHVIQYFAPLSVRVDAAQGTSYFVSELKCCGVLSYIGPTNIATILNPFKYSTKYDENTIRHAYIRNVQYLCTKNIFSQLIFIHEA